MKKALSSSNIESNGSKCFKNHVSTKEIAALSINDNAAIIGLKISDDCFTNLLQRII